jgi:hypothetical protein
MLRDNLGELIEPMPNSAGADPLALGIHKQRWASDDRLSCLENPRPERAESSLTENVTSPFQAEPLQPDSGEDQARLHAATQAAKDNEITVHLIRGHYPSFRRMRPAIPIRPMPNKARDEGSGIGVIEMSRLVTAPVARSHPTWTRSIPCGAPSAA